MGQWWLYLQANDDELDRKKGDVEAFDYVLSI